MKKILAIGLAILTTACADHPGMLIDYGPSNTQAIQNIDPAIGYQALKEATLCCNSLSELDYQAITEPGKFDFNITKESQAFEFTTGKSFVQGFALPKANGPITITISAPIIDSVFVPKLLLLNEQIQQRVLKFSKCQIHDLAYHANVHVRRHWKGRTC